jgi:hypothetical protein
VNGASIVAQILSLALLLSHLLLPPPSLKRGEKNSGTKAKLKNVSTPRGWKKNLWGQITRKEGEKNKYPINRTVKFPTRDVLQDLRQEIGTDTQYSHLTCSASNGTPCGEGKMAGTHDHGDLHG